MKKAGLKFTVLIISIALSGCIKDRVEEVNPDPNSKECPVEYESDFANTYVLTGEWKFLGFQDTATGQVAAPPCSAYLNNNKDFKMTLEFSDSNYAGGYAGINNYGGQYNLSDNQGLKFDSMTSTLMGGPDVLVAYEHRFLTTLYEIENYQIEHNFLTLFYGAQKDKMVFVAISDN